MGAPDVENLLEKIKHQLLYEPIKIVGATDELKMLENSLRLFKAFIEDNRYKFEESDLENSYSETLREIRKVVWEAEDLFDSLLDGEDEIDYSERDTNTRKALHGVAQEAESVGSKVVRMYDKMGGADISNSLRFHYRSTPQPDLINRKPLVDFKIKRELIVGFENEAEKLIGYLMKETEELDIISIVGVPGLGKTTLAWKAFQDPAIQNKFTCRVWVNVSSERTRRDILEDIVKQLYVGLRRSWDRDTSKEFYVYNYDDVGVDELSNEVFRLLRNQKFLMVMNDVRKTMDWDDLILALPLPWSNARGKVLITSRNEETDSHICRFLTHRESWLLLQYEVFGHTHCPSDLEEIGKLIVNQCDGLPLAIVMVGGILAYLFSSTQDMDSTRKSWKGVYERLKMPYLNKEDPLRFLERIVALTYDRLPYHLRACFLYLGMFPKWFEIPVWKLTLMWIAEGFIPEKKGINMEKTAEKYLDELIGLNLVRIDKTTIEGKAKTCRVDEAIHDFCQHEAAKRENFQELKISDQGIFEPPLGDIKKFRRLCIHSNFSDFMSSNPYGPQIRSFVCFSLEDINLPSNRISGIHRAFKKLRVLEAKPIKFGKLPSDLDQLQYLKYIYLSLNSTVLALNLSKLRNVQTLIVDTKANTLEIKDDIWSTTHLRHLKTNVSTSLPKEGRRDKNIGEGCGNLQTLGMISPQSCRQEVFDRARYLMKLSIGGRLAVLLDPKSGYDSFDSLGRLDNLQKLKMVHNIKEDPLQGLPPPYKFPPRLRSLTLKNTRLDWNYMTILGRLENLQVLKLKYHAFVGDYWKVVDGGFRSLEILQIRHTDLRVWVASTHHFPSLRRLEVWECEELLQIPIQLAYLPSFQMLDVYGSYLACESAERIQNIKIRQTNDFKLSISKSSTAQRIESVYWCRLAATRIGIAWRRYKRKGS